MKFLPGILLFFLCVSCVTSEKDNYPQFAPLFTQLDSLLEVSDFNGVIAIAEGD